MEASLAMIAVVREQLEGGTRYVIVGEGERMAKQKEKAIYLGMSVCEQ